MPHFINAALTAIGGIISLTALETILGIDNIIFLSILVGKLPRSQRNTARKLGLILALGMRILLLLTLRWLSSLTATLFTVMNHGISGRDLVLLIGGGFLIFKSTWEIFSGLEAEDPREQTAEKATESQKQKAFVITLVQIVLMDIVFSLDSVITAVGLNPGLSAIIIAMSLSMLIMLVFAKSVGEFVNRHPSMKVLALSFLVLIGTLLVAEGGGQHVSKGYVYFAMAFSVLVEFINLWIRKRSTTVTELHTLTRHASQLSDRGSYIPEELAKLVAHQDLSGLSREQLEERVRVQAARVHELEKLLADPVKADHTKEHAT